MTFLSSWRTFAETRFRLQKSRLMTEPALPFSPLEPGICVGFLVNNNTPLPPCFS